MQVKRSEESISLSHEGITVSIKNTGQDKTVACNMLCKRWRDEKKDHKKFERHVLPRSFTL